MSEVLDTVDQGSAEDAQKPSAGPGWKRWAGLLFKLAVAGALLTFVATQLTWRDTVWPPGADEEAAIEGEILADAEGSGGAHRPWEAERVRFRFPVDAVPAVDEKAAAVRANASERFLETGADGWRVTPGMPTLLAHLNLGIYLLAAGLFFCGMSLAAFRWYLLMRSASISFSFGQCFRLTFIGMFFNTVVPGLTGGDLVKAFLVARRTDRRAEAVVSVFVDRILGLIALAFLAGITVLFVLDTQPRVAFGVLGFVGVMVLGLVLFFSHPVRRLLRLEALLDRMPGGNLVRKVDEAVFVYRYRMGTVLVSLLLSFANHLVTITGVFLVGVSLASEGARGSLLDLLVIYPIVGVISAVPIAPAGLGVGETAFGYFYGIFGRSYDIGVLTSVIYRLTFVAWSLLGGVFLITGRERVPTDPLEGEGFAEPAVPAPAAPSR